MGKAQSKRSVDITTETKKGVDDEVTEKMGKIEDVDKKDINGDATVQPHSEKKDDNDDMENDKDITTEKNTEVQATEDSTEDVKTSADEVKNDDGIPEEISPLSDENAIKKSKKEKVKKKWSFRSFSFGKKDKQKPGNTEETSENASATANGADEEKTSPETEESQKEQASADNAPDGTVIHENGNATEPEINGQQTEEKSGDVKQIDDPANTTNNPITENNDLVKNDTAAIVTLQETENSSNVTSKSDTIESDTNLEENAADETSAIGKNVEEANRTVQQATVGDASVEAAAENKDIPADVKTEAISVNGTVDEIHQNGTNNVCVLDDEHTKAQIEVNINTDNKTSADTLEIISSSTSNNPSKAPVNFQNLNTSGGALDDVGVEHDAQKQDSRDLNESVYKNAVAISGESNEVQTDKSEVDVCMDEKFGDEPSPPPLPISPPPSQVSVFAFTNNEEAATDSLEKSEPINTQVEETTHQNISLPISDNYPHEPNNSNTNSEINSKNTNEINLENICLPNQKIADEKNNGDKITENDEDSTDNQIENKQSCIELEHLENGDLESKDHEVTTESNSHSKEESVLNVATEALDVVKHNEIDLLQHNNGISVPTICGDDHESEVANELQPPQSEDNCQSPVNADNIDLVNENTNNSPESLSHIILAKTDVDNDCLPPLNSQDKAQDDDKTISNKIDNLVREETKEFGNPMDLKERTTIAEVKQDPSVTCE